MRGMVVKDFSSSTGADLGGKFIFSNSTLWRSVRAGTLIVLSSTNSTQDLNASDFVLRANLSNPDLFDAVFGGFDINETDMILIKAADTGADGVAGGIHALSAGSRGSQYLAFNGKKLNATRALANNRPIAYALNGSRSLADFSSPSGADTGRNISFGAGNNNNNTSYISSLRSSSNTPPTLSLNGDNPMTIAHSTVFSDPGATAVDAEDGPLPVATTGSVNPLAVGTYTISYRATDSGNATTHVDRIVLVTDQTPPVVTLNGNATLEIAFGAVFSDPGATASDAVDGTVQVDVAGLVNPFAAGIYNLVYSATDAAGNTSPSLTRTVTVAKGQPEITQAPSASSIVSGQPLSASTLTGGAASVPGAFVWSAPLTIPAEGTSLHAVLFQPDDSANQTPASTSISVTVLPGQTSFESWAASQGLAGPQAAPEADPDGDGWTNAQEFAFGLDPKSPGGRLVHMDQTSEGKVRVSFLQREGLDYTILLATDLAEGFTETLQSAESENQSDLPAGFTRHEVLLPAGPKAFIRIEAAIP
jgi:hypothetical protein